MATILAEHEATATYAFNVGQDNFVGQTFTASQSGIVDTVSIVVWRSDVVSDDLTLELRTTASGLPTETVLGSVTVSSSVMGSVYFPEEFTTFDFSAQGVHLIAGVQYAIVAECIVCSGEHLLASADTYYWSGRTDLDDGYPAGRHVFYDPDIGEWTGGTDVGDLFFRVVPEPARLSLSVLAMGLLSASGVRKRESRVSCW